MSKDQALGALIFFACIFVAVGYAITVALPDAVKYVLPWIPWNAAEIRFGVIAAVVLFVLLAVLFVGAWIGWTMATTPPPKPIEELETEIEKTRENSKK